MELDGNGGVPSAGVAGTQSGNSGTDQGTNSTTGEKPKEKHSTTLHHQIKQVKCKLRHL